MSSRDQTILKVTNLKRSYGNFVAVNGLDLEVKEGEIYGFLGVNGAGKTTTIRMLMGIIAPESGTIELMGETTKRTTLKQKQKIGYVSQEQVFYPWMTAQMLGKFVGPLYPKWDKQEFKRLLNVLEVPPNRKSAHLSGGMRVKLALALALAPRPNLLLLDEPTAGMDPVARREFLDIIQYQAKEYGRTTFFSTHLLNEVERAADKVGIIHQGKKRFEGDLKLLQSRVRQIKIAPGTIIPPGFEVWKVKDGPPDLLTGMQEMIVDAPPEVWVAAPFSGESLSLDDIFISCVGMATVRI